MTTECSHRGYVVKDELVMHSFYVFFCDDENFEAGPMSLAPIEAPDPIAAVENAVQLYSVGSGQSAAVIRAEHITWVVPAAKGRS